MNERWGKDPLGDHLRLLQPGLLPDAHPRHARHAPAHLRLHAVHAPQGPAADEPVHDDLAVRARASGSSSSSRTSSCRCAAGVRRATTRGTRTRSSGRRPRRRPTRTSRGAFRPSTAVPTSTASPVTAPTTGPRASPAGRRPRTMAETTSFGRTPPAPRARGLHGFALAVAAATLLLVFAGGLVTSTESGLSVPDWPTTYGQNMFTFPVSKWVGGIRYEHVHRLIASGVGLLTVALAVWLARREPRRWVRRLGYFALAAVVAQGVLGGLTVLLLLPTAVSVAHACLAQTFFCLVVAIAVVTSPRWTSTARTLREALAASPVGRAAAVTAGAVFLQLLVGAVMRHTKAGLAIPDFPLSLGRVVPPLGSFPGRDSLRPPGGRGDRRRARRRLRGARDALGASRAASRRSGARPARRRPDLAGRRHRPDQEVRRDHHGARRRGRAPARRDGRPVRVRARGRAPPQQRRSRSDPRSPGGPPHGSSPRRGDRGLAVGRRRPTRAHEAADHRARPGHRGRRLRGRAPAPPSSCRGSCSSWPARRSSAAARRRSTSTSSATPTRACTARAGGRSPRGA